MRVPVNAILVGLAALLGGCATAGPPTVFGRNVQVTTADGGRPATGELLAVQDGQLVVRTARGPQPVPLAGVREVRIKRHAWGGRRGLGWTLAGGLVTGAAMTAACSRETSGCGGVGLTMFGLWAVLGGLSSLSMEQASHFHMKSPTADDLRPFARFPQGLPPGFPGPVQTSSAPGKK